MVLKFISVGSNFYQEDKYPTHPFIVIGKVESFFINTQKERKDYKKYEENDSNWDKNNFARIRVKLQERIPN